MRSSGWLAGRRNAAKASLPKKFRQKLFVNITRDNASRGSGPRGKAVEFRTSRGNDSRSYAWEKLLAEVKPIFTFIAYGRVAKFPAKQTKHTDNSHEDRRHGFGYSRQLLGITRTIFPIGPNTNRYATMSAVNMFSRLRDVLEAVCGKTSQHVNRDSPANPLP